MHKHLIGSAPIGRRQNETGFQRSRTPLRVWQSGACAAHNRAILRALWPVRGIPNTALPRAVRGKPARAEPACGLWSRKTEVGSGAAAWRARIRQAQVFSQRRPLLSHLIVLNLIQIVVHLCLVTCFLPSALVRACSRSCGFCLPFPARACFWLSGKSPPVPFVRTAGWSVALGEALQQPQAEAHPCSHRRQIAVQHTFRRRGHDCHRPGAASRAMGG